MSKAVKAVVVHVNGRYEIINEMSFAQMQEAVGGDVQIIAVAAGVDGWCNEEGKLKNLPHNGRATGLCVKLAVGLMPGDYIAGPMVLTGTTDGEGELTDVPQDLLDRFQKGEL